MSALSVKSADEMRPAERQANDLLKTAWQSDDKGFIVPVDPFEIAHHVGLKVFTASLEEDVSGMLVKRPGEDAEIYVRADDHEHRQRFTCAHELGHYVLRESSRSDDSFGFVDRRDDATAQGTNEAEIFANQFAAELLMPQDNVKRCVESLSDAALAVMFKVSVGAMKYRLQNLGIVR